MIKEEYVTPQSRKRIPEKSQVQVTQFIYLFGAEPNPLPMSDSVLSISPPKKTRLFKGQPLRANECKKLKT